VAYLELISFQTPFDLVARMMFTIYHIRSTSSLYTYTHSGGVLRGGEEEKVVWVKLKAKGCASRPLTLACL